jgi:hydrogenase nickel incorporation protein HypA/HybF
MQNKENYFMHELSLAMDLVDRAIDIALKEKANKVSQLNVKIGLLSGVDLDSFRFAFPEACKKTILEDCELIIEESSGREFEFLNMEVVDV